jgi:hypothetical protein
LATSDYPDGWFDWDSAEALGSNAALLGKQGLDNARLDNDWELLIAPTVNASNISLVIKYSIGQE